MKTLRYNDKELDPNPTNHFNLQTVARDLVDERTVHVILEPGDATRYDLTLMPMWATGLEHLGNYDYEDRNAGLIVVRSVSGRIVASEVYLMNRDFHDNIEDLATGNEWSADLLQWWFEVLYEAITERRLTLTT